MLFVNVSRFDWRAAMADGRITADVPRHAVTREKLIAASTPQD